MTVTASTTPRRCLLLLSVLWFLVFLSGSSLADDEYLCGPAFLQSCRAPWPPTYTNCIKILKSTCRGEMRIQTGHVIGDGQAWCQFHLNTYRGMWSICNDILDKWEKKCRECKNRRYRP